MDRRGIDATELAAAMASMPGLPGHGALEVRQAKDVELFETLAAVNERFAKLQAPLAAAMRHAALLMSEPTDSFLMVLALFEKNGVIASVDDWQCSRTACD